MSQDQDSAASIAAAPSVGVRWLREWSGPGQDGFRLGREGSRLVAEWDGLGTLRTSLHGQDAELTAAEGVDPRYEQKWRTGAVSALLRHLEGRPTLHASAVSLDGRALVFVGESGAGKSTCAAELCARAGAELLADDLAQLDVIDASVVVSPTEAFHWLLPDSAAALGRAPASDRKEQIPAIRLAAAPCPLAAVVSLSFVEGDGPPTLTRIRGEAAFAVINAVYIRFIVDDDRVHLRDLDIMSRIVAAAPVVRLSRPRSLARLNRTASILAELASAQAVRPDAKFREGGGP